MADINITEYLELKESSITVAPIDIDGEFEISLNDIYFGTVSKYLVTEDAIKLANYILASVNQESETGDVED